MTIDQAIKQKIVTFGQTPKPELAKELVKDMLLSGTVGNAAEIIYTIRKQGELPRNRFVQIATETRPGIISQILEDSYEDRNRQLL